jgi:hypothetical protein
MIWAKRALYAGAAGCVVTVLAACGSSSTSSSTAASASSASASKTATPAATPATLSQLQNIVLRPSDLPVGWKGTPYVPDANDPADSAALMKCIGARDTESDQVADAHSDDFNLGNATISSDASSYRSQSDLDSDVTALHSPKLSACFTQELKKELPVGSTFESSSLKITPGSAGGPSNVVATGGGVIDIEDGGQQIAVYVTVDFITGPLIQAQVDAENVGAAVPASVVNPLVAAVASRAAKG